MLKEHGLSRVDYLSLDVEGAEIAAITGAKRALQDGGVLIYEDHGSDLTSEVTAHLMELPGIRVYSIEKQPQLVENLDHLTKIKTDRYKGYNFLAGQKGSALLGAIVQNLAKQ